MKASKLYDLFGMHNRLAVRMSEAVFRVVPVPCDARFALVSSLDASTCGVNIEILDKASMKPISDIHLLPGDVLAHYAQTKIDVANWMSGDVADFPIPVDDETLAWFREQSYTVEEISTESF